MVNISTCAQSQVEQEIYQNNMKMTPKYYYVILSLFFDITLISI